MQSRSTTAGVVATVCHTPSTDVISVALPVRLFSTTICSRPSAVPGNVVHEPPGIAAAPVALFWSVSKPTPTATSAPGTSVSSSAVIASLPPAPVPTWSWIRSAVLPGYGSAG